MWWCRTFQSKGTAYAKTPSGKELGVAKEQVTTIRTATQLITARVMLVKMRKRQSQVTQNPAFYALEFACL